MVLNEDCILTLQWWIDNVHKECNSIQRGKPDIVIRSVSSDFGWDGVSETDQRQTGGHWKIKEQKEHINYLELYAWFLTLKALNSHVSNVIFDCVWTIQYLYLILTIWVVGKKKFLLLR